ncbi:Transketolase central region [Catenulispora acidiphila DSM 44928]|uniref:Transketolase central region n=1 Tax=Catenulispora acidiphila (strain DSM 44928 / JCM 14897 / NBRC 102108 / NRRL B-24433 / ID139908) TaxID=479433 RepID=C7Q1G4_CATAD|nr:transketolase [Catenulispora acidiphila]ACU73693.1 Transketolase central region [Catenulispora acidiphila DSM 44928]
MTERVEHGSPIDKTIDQNTDLADVFNLAQQLRVDAIRCSTAAGSGHPTSGMSAADVMAVLMARHLTYDWDLPDNPGNDHLIFSKGHASPLLYAMYAAAGAISEDVLVTTYRRAGSALEGHPTPQLPWVDAATGSLGQGIGIGVGVALAARMREAEHTPYRVWVLCGDSEMAEGSVWEALDAARRHELANYTVIVDVNRLGQRGPTELEWDLDAYARRVEAFGAQAIPIDGHDLAQIDAALHSSATTTRPTVILAKTRKGRGFSEIENSPDWHGKPLPAEMAERAIAELGGVRRLRVVGPLPDSEKGKPISHQGADVTLPSFEEGGEVAPRKAFGATLAALADRPDLVVLDAEVGNSTYTNEFAKVCPDRFFESYIAEQQMIATAVGLSAVGYKPIAATFAAFLTRAHDFIRMGAISRTNLAVAGTHCGVEIGEDGPSQMALEDLAMMRSVHGSTVLYPADATAAAALTATVADLPGISYLRLTRGAYPVLYPHGEEFPVGGSKVLRHSEEDDVTVFAAGVTVHEALKAQEELQGLGVRARVVDLYSVKPLDHQTVAQAARTKAVVIVEDHHPEGGLGEAVMATLADHRNQAPLVHLAVRHMPDSRSAAEQLDAAGISARHIVRAAQRLLSDLRPADAQA